MMPRPLSALGAGKPLERIAVKANVSPTGGRGRGGAAAGDAGRGGPALVGGRLPGQGGPLAAFSGSTVITAGPVTTNRSIRGQRNRLLDPAVSAALEAHGGSHERHGGEADG